MRVIILSWLGPSVEVEFVVLLFGAAVTGQSFAPHSKTSIVAFTLPVMKICSLFKIALEPMDTSPVSLHAPKTASWSYKIVKVCPLKQFVM